MSLSVNILLTSLLKNISEPTYKLTEAIEDGRIKVYPKAREGSRYTCEMYNVKLVLDGNLLAECSYIVRRRLFTDEHDFYSTYIEGFTEDERECITPFIKKAINKYYEAKAKGEQLKREENAIKIRNNITEKLNASSKNLSVGMTDVV